MLKFLRKLNKAIARIEEGFLILIVLFMVLAAFLQVILRSFFDHGILWGDILLRHLVLWIGFIGASLATKNEKHINIDLLTRYLKGRWHLLVQAAILLFSFIITIFLTHAGYRFVQVEKEFGSTLFKDIPTWYFQLIIPLGFFLMSMRFLFLAVEKLAMLGKKGEATS